MDGLQGAILSIKLKYLSKWNDARRENSRRYNSLLSDLDGIVTPWEAYYARHVYHIYAILSENRDELIKNLSGSGIYCGVHYPVPVHLTSAYRHLGLDKGSFPVAEKAADHLVSLPMFAELSKGQIDYVADQIHRLTVKPAAAFNQAHEGVLI
jgi:dTDP-4-amino-4,6-dideoxygalactose transaminase